MTIQINGTSGISGVDGSAATPALQGSDTNTGISFGADTVNLITGGVTRATTDASGYFRLSGSGIQFNGDTAAANALDDYEEGTWTPSFTGYGGAYTNRSGHYTKIGNTVCAWCYIQTSTAGSSGQGVEVTGLPYPLNISSYAAASQLWGDSWTTGRSGVAMLGINNSAAVQMIHGSCGGGSRPSVVLSDIGVGNLLFQITYRT